MISKETYRDLVLAGSSIVKDIIECSKLVEECTEQEISMPPKVFDYMTTSPHTVEAFQSLVWVAGEIDFGVQHQHDYLRIMYADTVSMFAFDTPSAERYLELVYKHLTTRADIVFEEQLREIEKQTPQEVLFWARRNL